MISLMVSDEKARALYGHFRAPRPYIRMIPSPLGADLVGREVRRGQASRR
jgi:hypothetical protein